MRAGNGAVPWPIIAVVVIIVLVAINSYAVGSLLLPLLFAGIGAWLIVGAVRGLRPGAGPVTYWRGQRVTLETGRRREHVVRSAFAILLGAAIILTAGWYLLSGGR